MGLGVYLRLLVVVARVPLLVLLYILLNLFRSLLPGPTFRLFRWAGAALGMEKVIITINIRYCIINYYSITMTFGILS